MMLGNRSWKLFLVVVVGISMVLLATAVQVRSQATHHLVPIGAAYEEDTLMHFAAEAAAHDSDGVITIRVLPISYHRDPYKIGGRYRRSNIELAQERADQIGEACAAIAAEGQSCSSVAVDIQIRDDALDSAKVALLGPEVDGVYVLGGDQTIAMLVTANTPTEAALTALYEVGAAIGGNSAGAAVISRYMIGGYTGDNFAWHGLNQGAVDLWYGADDTERRGFIFGLESAIIDQHVLERGRLARLLQAMVEKPGEKLAVGLDWGTSAAIHNEQIVTGVTGWYAAVALDAETYGAAANAAYLGDAPAILDIHDVALHVIPAGAYGYDLVAHQPLVDGSVQAAPDISGRNFDFLLPPAGSGPLFLSGDAGAASRGEVMSQFVAAAEATGKPTLVLAGGTVTATGAEGDARHWRNRLTALGLSRPEIAMLTADTDLDALAAQMANAGAIFLTADNQEILAEQVARLHEAGLDSQLADWWHSGGVLLLNHAAAGAAGSWMSAEATPTGSFVEYQSSDSFLNGYIHIAPGLDLVPGAVFETRVLYDYLYGRLVSHIVAHPENVSIGLDRGMALVLTPERAAVVGDNPAFVVDGRYAQTLSVGTNDAYAATWLLVDTFAPGNSLTE